jgi:hypothetical protein
MKEQIIKVVGVIDVDVYNNNKGLRMLKECPFCKGEGLLDEMPRYNKQKRNKEIRRVAKALEGTSKKFVLFRITEYLRERETRLSEPQIYRILKKP